MELGSIGDTIAIELALLERRYQCVKWPDQVYKLREADSRETDPFLHISEEVGEIAKALSEGVPDIDLAEEICQVTALGLAWLGDALCGNPFLRQKLRDKLLAKTRKLEIERAQANHTRWLLK